jgi:hypothetical protein
MVISSEILIIYDIFQVKDVSLQISEQSAPSRLYELGQLMSTVRVTGSSYRASGIPHTGRRITKCRKLISTNFDWPQMS